MIAEINVFPGREYEKKYGKQVEKRGRMMKHLGNEMTLLAMLKKARWNLF